jgi:hypothetical protein
LPNANETVDVIRYWAPVVGVVSILLLSLALPALKWLWELKSNHLAHVEASTTKTVSLLEEQGKVLVEIRTILAERK